MKTYFATVAWLAISLTACSKPGKEKEDDPGTVQSGYLKGTVKDSKGNALPNITVLARNTLYYNSYKAGVSDANGNYKIALPNGTYTAWADFNVTYNGKTYQVELHPDNDSPFSQEGAVVNFQWKLTGKLPGQNAPSYGGTVIVDKSLNSQVYDTENIEFTLTPQGPLIDGSTGSTIKIKSGQPQTSEYGKLTDIPIGRYKISAVYNNQAMNLRNSSLNNSPFTTELILDFEPTTLWGDNMAFIQYEE
ncbi:MAG TPA: carboxypeptidase-like regulatory domain-containing protein [Chitinophagaceae bacterium]|nr:carboxypeptidase-like regulatory domain-containing protein [Chitinophagaceae bacterium]